METAIKIFTTKYWEAIRFLTGIYDLAWEKLKLVNWKKFFKGIEFTIIGIIACLSILVFLDIAKIDIPLKLYVIQSGSMEPTIKTGSVSFSIGKPEYYVNDIVSFEIAGKKIVTHRIYEINETGEFVTKGDANEDVDSTTIRKDQILGKILFSIPLIGYLIGFAKTFQGLTVLIIIPGTIIVYEELKSFINEIKLHFKKK